MNPRILRLFWVLSAGFLALLLTVTYWQVWAASSLQARRDNPRLVYDQLAVDRGLILSSDGVVLAHNQPQRVNGRTLYPRLYPLGELAVAPVGYSSIRVGQSGEERAQNDYLTGANTDLAGGFSQLFDTIRGRHLRGNDVVLTISARAQHVAMHALAATGHAGAVVALDPATGQVRVMASWPTFNPNLVATQFATIQRGSNGALLNRATQGLYPPGSTFKIVTAAAALDTGRYTPASTFKGGVCISVQAHQLCNANNETAPDPNNLSDALTYSYNTTFAQLGEQLGASTLESMMQRFGFWSQVPLDYPHDQMNVAGVYASPGRIALPGQPVDIARVAIGQGGLLVTPLQMALVTATIANGGVLVAPHLVSEVRTHSGRVVQTIPTDRIGTVISPTTASALAAMMQHVVDEGTGTAAQIGGLAVAGKTGTAETGRPGLHDAWFVAFAPVSAPRVAIAVIVEDTTAYGGQIAAPIARQVIEALG